VTTNTTLFDGADPNSVRAHFDELMAAGVESMMVSPGYTYDKAPDQKHFLGRARSKKMFRAILSNRKKTWRFNASPIFMEFLMGKKDLTCTPWGMPTFSIFGWQKPCYLLQDGYADTSRNCWMRPSGKITAPSPAIRSAPTAWCTAAMKPARWITPSAACVDFGLPPRRLFPPDTKIPTRWRS